MQPHALALDSQGRLFVGDRSNNRVQVMTTDGKFIADWAQFSRPSGLSIDKNDMIYVGGLRIGLRQPGAEGLDPRHPRRQHQGRQGDVLHPRPAEGFMTTARSPPKVSPSTPPATSMAPKSGPGNCRST